MQQYVVEFKNNLGIYMPIKDDLIDKKLGDYLNGYAERQKLKVKFTRESGGVYSFGTKKVSMKVEKDRVMIRVGGGYLLIDEFLEKYTQSELDKQERSSPLKRIIERAAAPKTNGAASGYASKEGSPSQRKKSPSTRNSVSSQKLV